MISTALAYGAFGWHVIPVHGMTTQLVTEPVVGEVAYPACTCRLGRNCPEKMRGKHPVHGRWQNGHRMSTTDVMATWSAEAGGNPYWNVGILTGVATGGRPLFVLDVDPDNGGRETLSALVERHGQLTPTRIHRTGSNGRHYLYLVPDGMTIRNNQKRLGPGVDIRGLGGMIVAPPSVSGKGAYELLNEGREISEPPAWLVELLTVPEGVAVDLPTVVAEDLPDWSDLDPETQARVTRYAVNGVAGAVSDYFEAPPGRGNDQLYRSACAAIEIAQSPWNLITVDQVVRDLDTARVQRCAARPGGGQDETEFRQTVRSAHNAVIGQGRPLPPDPHPIDGLAFDVSDFVSSEVDARNCEGAGQGSEGVSVIEIDPVDALLARMLDRDALDSIPPVTPLIRDVLDMDSESWVIGAPGGFKSFVALDWAAHVATGLMWRGKAVTQGRVVYLVAEGQKGIPARVRAWEATYETRMEGVSFLPLPVQVADLGGRIPAVSAQWRVLVEACRRIEPVLIVLDTQARITVGLEENSATAMGVLIEAIRTLKEATGACVLAVHHTGRDGSNARGSSALDGAQDTELRVERPTRKAERDLLTAKIVMDKQKDGSEGEPFDIRMRVVDLGTHPETGRVMSSLALEPYDPFSQPLRHQPDHLLNLTEYQKLLLESIREHGVPGYGTPAGTLIRWTKERTGVEIKHGSAGTALAALVRKGLIYRQGVQYFLDDPDGHVDS